MLPGDESEILRQLPAELSQAVGSFCKERLDFLDAVASAALIPSLTGRLFVYFETIFSDLSARWLHHQHRSNEVEVIASFAKILPFAPYLSVYLDEFLTLSHLAASRPTTELPERGGRPSLSPLNLHISDDLHLTRILLACWRLCAFSKRRYSQLAKLSDVQSLFQHRSRVVRYLAVRIFCQKLDASDAKLEALISEHVGVEALISDYDGAEVDYAFLTLHERARAKAMYGFRQQLASNNPLLSFLGRIPSQDFTRLICRYGDTLLPRPSGPPERPSSLTLTPTTVDNLAHLSGALQEENPILLYGVSGAGKTSLIQELARELGKNDGLVTLHLNEQTDAKMLLGLYTTGSKPGSFKWRPGILTTAVKEGRWVLIEDLDRAPTEVMSTLLPLIERGELVIPSRGETIRASEGFRLFATIRVSLSSQGQENLPSLVGLRFWNCVLIKVLPRAELESIIREAYPSLSAFAADMLNVFGRVTGAQQYGSSRQPLLRALMERPISTRDLFKWCKRCEKVLNRGSVSSVDQSQDWAVLREAAECFVVGFKETAVQEKLLEGIADEMRVPRDWTQSYLTAYNPRWINSSTEILAGRISLSKQSSRTVKSTRAFAETTHVKRLLEQTAAAVQMQEPVLLVGETGIGKTTAVQHLADSLGRKLVAVNLSQQSEAGDLLGGFKPVNARSLAVPLKEEFEDLFREMGVSEEKNKDYMERIAKRFAREKWSEVSKEWRKAPKMFEAIISQLQSTQAQAAERPDTNGQPTKRRKVDTKLHRLQRLKPRWDSFLQALDQFDRQVSTGAGNFAFSFVEGNIVKALRNGDWILLDEINLASPDTLESITDLLQSGSDGGPFLLLTETGNVEKILAHPNFRVFAAMNPATDVGKRDLPPGIRSRFTEIYVPSPDRDEKDLLIIVKKYLAAQVSEHLAHSIVKLYTEIRQLMEQKKIVDGADEVPHFSLRTLSRVLTYANEMAPIYGIERALYDGFCMGFLTVLSQESEKIVLPRIRDHLGQLRKQKLAVPRDRDRNYVKFSRHELESQQPEERGKRGAERLDTGISDTVDDDAQYWLAQGEETPTKSEEYVITRCIRRNLFNLVRAVSTRRYPILIQGPTSAGKTSMIEYLAKFTGNKFVRINNHEHTDLQEYLGTYVSGQDGRLVFQEGLLVQALRRGSWIVLDELNLAPTEVLEALNRLLDDNRELLIPETQEVVRPHPNFMLFATQNPPGLYGGRKVLSRAFRNRFLELHFDDIPENELEKILQGRCKDTSPTHCSNIVKVYKELSRMRQSGRVFEQKNSFATLRDLFRWAIRGAREDNQHVADYGFMLLGEKVRDPKERMDVKHAIEKIFKVEIDLTGLYSAQTSPALQGLDQADDQQDIVWTSAMRRLYVLLWQAVRNNEPVLLVGETGCGKTTVCQLLAKAQSGNDPYIVNAHQNTETGDLIGSQRPVRNRAAVMDLLRADLIALNLPGHSESSSTAELLQLYHALSPEAKLGTPEPLRLKIADQEAKSKALFEWCDGPLVSAMKTGQFFLLDEISLADDSVLERLNSVLEPGRSLLLAEKGITDSFVKASEGFHFLATMNPGGDFGKKELSPALRNRFTEIWVPALSERDEIQVIVESNLASSFQTTLPSGLSCAQIIVDFAQWFGQTFRSSSASPFSLRDILAWAEFMNHCRSSNPSFALAHGAGMVFIDTIGANPAALMVVEPGAMRQQRESCLGKLSSLIGLDIASLYHAEPVIQVTNGMLKFGEFGIPVASGASTDPAISFQAPTTKTNAMRVARALQVRKPILLEGNPGVGKTTLVTALAQACGMPLTRINLSDQTDLMDLFGTDVPVEGAEAGTFAWQDAPFLQAMRKGEWVLLDEMNLASQSVLEGLNACLDHREEVYISELNQTFKSHPKFRLFAAQNPHHQGGGRKGLPTSFVNRFTVVYADVFTVEDLSLIARTRFKNVDPDIINRMIHFVSLLESAVAVHKTFGAQGAPWEFNLRDTLRWLELLASKDPLISLASPDDFLDVVIRQRFRTTHDREEVSRLFSTAFQKVPSKRNLYHNISTTLSQVGFAMFKRNSLLQPTSFPGINVVPRLAELESIMVSVKHDMPCILVGPSGSGKTALLHHVAALAGKALVIFPLNADVDTMDLIGGFEQADPQREVNTCLTGLRRSLTTYILHSLPENILATALDLSGRIESYQEGGATLQEIVSCIELLEKEPAVPLHLLNELSVAQTTLREARELENPRFQWLDGVIVRAVETGQWLVLDHANLCSASVLDRLNSLLERPNGYLSINEHTGPDGEPRIIQTHPDFRVFLTIDPRYGELSRAMRNRSVEIYLDYAPLTVQPYAVKIAPVEGSKHRFQVATEVLEASAAEDHVDQLAFFATNILSIEDTGALARYIPATTELGILAGGDWQSAWRNQLTSLWLYLQSQDSASIRQAIFQLWQSAAGHLSLDSTDRFALVQPIHPLQNEHSLLLIGPYMQNHASWLATCFEYFTEVRSAREAIETESHKATAGFTRISSLSRLQRSLVSKRVASVAKDTTVNGAEFLMKVIEAAAAYITDHTTTPPTDVDYRYLLRTMFFYWHRIFQSLSATVFDDAKFQALLSLGIKLFAKDGPRDGLQSVIPALVESCFVIGFKLTTGLSMEQLWRLFRPEPIRQEATLQQVGIMESLAARFDELRRKSNATVEDLASAMLSLSKAYAIVRTPGSNGLDVTGLISDLTSVITSLEAKTGDGTASPEAFLVNEFETLRRISVLDRLSKGVSSTDPSDLSVLSDLPTIAQMRLYSASGNAQSLQCIDYVLAKERDLHPWTSPITQALMLKLDAMASVGLKHLHSIEVELPKMGNMLSKASETLSTDLAQDLNRILWQLFLEVFSCHGTSLRQDITRLRSSLSQSLDPAASNFKEDWSTERLLERLPGSAASWPHHLRAVFEKHFSISLLALITASKTNTRKERYSSLAWIHFSLGCVELYVPDKIFDPYLRSRVEKDFHADLGQKLDENLSTLRQFQEAFTGQQSSVRQRLLEAERRTVESQDVSVETVYRPQSSELLQLQAEFNNVLTISRRGLPLTADWSGATEINDLEPVWRNVVQLIDRLSAQSPAYQDIVIPLINLLRCLQLGLSLASTARASESTVPGAKSAVFQFVPFIGGHISNAQTAAATCQDPEFLHYMGAISSVDSVFNIGQPLRLALFDSFDNVYSTWRVGLDKDRKTEQANQSLYRFQGSWEDEEELDQAELDELFPGYATENDQNADSQRAPRSARDRTAKFAELHRHIFGSPLAAQTALKDLCLAVARQVSADGMTQPGVDRLLLPTTLLALHEKMESLTASTNVATYNFYTDINLSETRKLVSLLGHLLKRFQALQAIDEISHLQPISDVIAACRSALERSQCNDPLAALLPRVENLYGILYDWENGNFAPSIYKATTLTDQLKSMIKDWRRLELSTWSRLFDMEEKKCSDEASAWWFIAYEAIIFGPSHSTDEDIDAYVIKLLEILQSYLAEAIIGQYAARLRLVQQLKLHLDALVLDRPSSLLVRVRDSVDKFVEIYGRYEPKIAQVIGDGRATLKKTMDSILQMFAWRDDNIAALRESARKSHQKLFRLVRKFREVLGRPARSIIEQGLPEKQTIAAAGHGFTSQPAATEFDQEASLLCHSVFPTWAEDAQSLRLSNGKATVARMASLGALSDSTTSAPDALIAFVTQLEESAASLRRETPAFLNEENAAQVKHLKTRKTKLLSETLAALGTMGFSRNLNEVSLTKQNSLAAIVSRQGRLELSQDFGLGDMNYFYHQLLSIGPKVRQASQEYSDDLSRRSVQDSAGYFEGILFVAVQQHDRLSDISRKLLGLTTSVSQLESLVSGGVETTFMVKTTSSDEDRALAWAVEVVKMGLRLLQIHAKLGNLDNQEVTDTVQKRLFALTTLSERFKALPRLPNDLTTTERMSVQAGVRSELAALQGELQAIKLARPDLAFITEQMELWTHVDVDLLHAKHSNADLNSFHKTVANLSGKLLVAIQRFAKEKERLPEPIDNKWLDSYSKTLPSIVDALGINSITAEIHTCLSVLRSLRLDDPAIQKTASALIRLVLPILQQYTAVYRQTTFTFIQLHVATCRMGFMLSKLFVQLASQGFCSPQEKSNEKSEESGKLEGGTGLGEGEGAEDISKDVQPDEDLSELAQEKDKSKEGEIEDEEDAVDMGDEDLEGELGGGDDINEDDKHSKSGDDDESDAEMDEEAGDVDDLDPTAVDEKLWDGKDEDSADKDQKGDNSKGQQKDDEQAAAEDTTEQRNEPNQQEQADGNDENPDLEEDDSGNDQDESLTREELNKQDQNVQETDVLALPEDMDIDGGDSMSSDGDDDLEQDELSDREDGQEEMVGDKESDTQSLHDADQVLDEADGRDEVDEDGLDEVDEGDVTEQDPAVDMDVDAQDDEKDGDQPNDDAEKNPQQPFDDSTTDQNNVAPSDVKSGGQQAEAELDGADGDDSQAKADQKEHGEMGESSPDQAKSSGNRGVASRSQDQVEPSDEAQPMDKDPPQPFKQLGDALERWYRNQREIQNAPKDQDAQQNHDSAAADLAPSEFQHLQDENAPADAQALGGATDDEIRPMDDSMAIDNEMEDTPANGHLMPQEDGEENDEDIDTDPQQKPAEPKSAQSNKPDETQAGSATRQGAFEVDDDAAMPSADEQPPLESDDEDVQETSTQLSATHIQEGGETGQRDFAEALQMWTAFQSKTQALALSLTSQLRLILTPSQSTKLSGAYRTGKRLNIKKIIPYIASSYKRDKIWMRRAVPTKRAYQILLCVDDSRSMAETRSGRLALESLVMVSRSLAMLEAGQVGVLGFGTDVFVAHDLAEPFASPDVGARALQKFTFGQQGTDVHRLLQETIERFRAARFLQGGGRGAGAGGEDLWQLALVLSDGVMPSSDHARVRPLLREAMEERIMVVFIVLDDTSSGNSNSQNNSSTAKPTTGGSTSILNMRSVQSWTGDTITYTYYLDTFPFQYYLIIHDIEDLPSALAGLLRTWFAEVNA